MTESFGCLTVGPMLAVHASILLLNADWSGRLQPETRLMASEAKAESETLS